MARPRKNPLPEGQIASEKRVSKKPWKPAQVAPVINGVDEDEFRTRWVNSKDPINMQRKIAEGWQFINSTTFPNIKDKNAAFFDTAEYNPAKGNGLEGAIQYREMVGMVLPMDDYEARQEYIQQQTDLQTRSRVKQTDSQLYKDLTESANRVGSQLQDSSTTGRLVIE